MDVVVRLLLVVAGTVVVLATLVSAVRTVVVPRAEQVLLTRVTFAALRPLFHVLARLRQGYSWTDRVLALYAPAALLCLPLVWLTSVFVGFTLLFLAVPGTAELDADALVRAFAVAGSSLLTLGFARPETVLGEAVAFVGAGLTIAIVVLLLVTYLPAMYSAFAAREREVVLLEARAGAPPTGLELLTRLARIDGLGELTPLWERWEEWFASVQGSHTSLPALAYFRSQRPDQHWVCAAGAMLDGAALYVACVDHRTVASASDGFVVVDGGGAGQQVRFPSAELCIRAGYLCLRDVARVFRRAFDPEPGRDTPISIARDEFDEALAQLEGSGVPLRSDRDACWQDWRGWRVNYDAVLLGLADLTAAPSAPWTSDRSPAVQDRPGRGPVGSRGR